MSDGSDLGGCARGARAENLAILGISGSLRRRSYNTALLQAAAQLLPSHVTFELAEIGDLPLYDDDLRQGAGYPASVARLREQIAAADAVWIASPEYNFSYSGVLKNALDWASRPPAQPFFGKPIALMGASAGMLGSARAQYHLRQIFVYLDAYVLNVPEVFVGLAQTKFDDCLTLRDEATYMVLEQHVKAFLQWIVRVKGGAAWAG